MSKRIDIVGKKYFRLFVVENAGVDKHNKTLFRCLCDCGKYVIIKGSSLTTGNTKSCGCLAIESISNINKTHGQSKIKIYKVWLSMNKRCRDFNDISYKNYGGRGIIVCDEWKNSFEAFRDWALNNGYKDKLTIERIDVNGNYCPENCKWATRKEQAKNTRRTHYITYQDKTMNMKDWANYLKIDYHTLANRILTYKWSIEKSFTTSVRKQNK